MPVPNWIRAAALAPVVRSAQLALPVQPHSVVHPPAASESTVPPTDDKAAADSAASAAAERREPRGLPWKDAALPAKRPLACSLWGVVFLAAVAHAVPARGAATAGSRAAQSHRADLAAGALAAAAEADAPTEDGPSPASAALRVQPDLALPKLEARRPAYSGPAPPELRQPEPQPAAPGWPEALAAPTDASAPPGLLTEPARKRARQALWRPAASDSPRSPNSAVASPAESESSALRQTTAAAPASMTSPMAMGSTAPPCLLWALLPWVAPPLDGLSELASIRPPGPLLPEPQRAQPSAPSAQQRPPVRPRAHRVRRGRRDAGDC